MSQQELLNGPYVCLQPASGVSDMKQVLNEGSGCVARPGVIRHVTAAEPKNTATDDFDKMSKQGYEKFNFKEERLLERKNALQYSHDVDSLSNEQKVGNSKDLTLTNGSTSKIKMILKTLALRVAILR